MDDCVEKVGVLLVHGIGQQARYGHLEIEVADLARALDENAQRKGWPAPVIRARSRSPEMRGAMQAAWGGTSQPPIIVEVETETKLIELHFHEVWWADLSDRTSLVTLTRFYAWALGMWLKPALNRGSLGGQSRMRFPEPRSGPPTWFQKAKYRAYLGLVALVVFLTIPLSLFARLLRIAFPTMPATLLAEYLGDVKLYQDLHRVGTARVEDLGLPPRVSIRARMVNALVEMASADYGRWYICAHSLGSVIALNGIMETEQALPNYLTPETLELAKQRGLLIETPDPARRLNDGERVRMLPPRPAGLSPSQVIDRGKLFATLRGLLTYGSPLERFRVLWPEIVPLNKESEPKIERAFQKEMSWINLCDPTDPVGSMLEAFDPKQSESHPQPENVPYRAGWLHLLSHISYLALRDGPCAARTLADWFTTGTANWDALKLSSRRRRALQFVQYLCWLVLLGIGLSLVTIFTELTGLRDKAQAVYRAVILFELDSWWQRLEVGIGELKRWVVGMQGTLIAWSVAGFVLVLLSGGLLWILQTRAERKQRTKHASFRGKAIWQEAGAQAPRRAASSPPTVSPEPGPSSGPTSSRNTT